MIIAGIIVIVIILVHIARKAKGATDGGADGF